MSGQFLRRNWLAEYPPVAKHTCSTPSEAFKGDIWWCHACGRRWTCTDQDRALFGFPPTWRRRWLPWPRPPRYVQPDTMSIADRVPPA